VIHPETTFNRVPNDRSSGRDRSRWRDKCLPTYTRWQLEYVAYNECAISHCRRCTIAVTGIRGISVTDVRIDDTCQSSLPCHLYTCRLIKSAYQATTCQANFNANWVTSLAINVPNRRISDKNKTVLSGSQCQMATWRREQTAISLIRPNRRTHR
jgi:hypothetical protein